MVSAEAAAAVWAGKGLLPGMDPQVGREVPPMDEGFVAVWAGEAALLCVAPLVGQEVSMVDEGLPAQGARELLFLCMEPLVGQEVTPMHEALMAQRACEGVVHLVVGPQVLVEAALDAEGFATTKAAERTLSGVDSLVGQEV